MARPPNTNWPFHALNDEMNEARARIGRGLRFRSWPRHRATIGIVVHGACVPLLTLDQVEPMPLRKGIAVYPGVFDPVHYGHLDVIQRGHRLVDKLVVAVGDNPEKSPLFNQTERVDLVKSAVKQYSNVEVVPFNGLAVRFVRSIGAHVM